MTYKVARMALLVGALAMMTACGGGGDSAGGTGGSPTPTPTPTPSSACSLRERQDWAAATLREWYLFPDTLPASLSPAPYTSVESYIDALTGVARSQGRDRYFTYLTSIAEEDAYYDSGSSAGLGVRFATDPTQTRLFVIEAFENGAALDAGIDRGAEIMAIGTTAANLQNVSSLFAAGGADAVVNALGPDTAGTTRLLRVSDAVGIRNISVTKKAFDLMPVSSRYGARIIDDGGRRVGYVNLRSFIHPADQPLRDAFAMFKAQGVTDIILDLRYNGGGLVSTSELLGDLLGADRASTDIFSRLSFRPEKSAENETKYFAAQSQSVAPTRIAFIGSGATASASELIINAFIPYLDARAALIGANSYGKPVGQIAVDRPACDDRLRVVAFATQNSAGNADYYGGLATSMKATCQAVDDIRYPLGDPREASVRQALDFIAGRSCTPIGSASSGASASTASARVGAPASAARVLLAPARPSPAQKEVPGLF
ncbi:S41 family peptidase [Sphingobium sp. CAP-1]|uniref:S41 family peptidase n=1 Tax=Sphingobium sp. CAP-1 TaxID=2676077 RepID=UPI0012BB3678|nr:S41 family peptidase [Sphingobium sp. CAP-1]QGP78607.1 peptidase S41 [Sphingobium sp. CAP-1]